MIPPGCLMLLVLLTSTFGRRTKVEKWSPALGSAGFSQPVSPHRSSIRTFSEDGVNPAVVMSAVGAAPNVKVGDMIPDVSLDLGFPPEKFNLKEYAKGKKIVLMGLPGAFTGTWSTVQIPGYLAKEAELKAKGITDVLTFCVNDGAVMKAWAADQKIEGSIIKFLGDPRSELTEALGLVLDHPGPMSVLGTPRVKRFSMLVEDGVIKTINVAEKDDDPAGDASPEDTLVEKMLADA